MFFFGKKRPQQEKTIGDARVAFMSKVAYIEGMTELPEENRAFLIEIAIEELTKDAAKYAAL